MISGYMGPHYGNDVHVPGAGTYQLSLLVSPPVSARHVEYANVWLKPHRVNFTSTGSPSHEWCCRRERDPTDADAAALRPRSHRRRRGRRRDRCRCRARDEQQRGEGAARPARGPALRASGKPARLGRHAGPRRGRKPDLAPFDRLLFFDVRGNPTPAHARVLEAALRTLERTYRWGPSGLLFTAGWGPGYFERVLGPLPDSPSQGTLGLRAAGDRRLRPLPALRLRQRTATRGRRGSADPRRSAGGSRRMARSVQRLAVARDANRIRWHRASRRHQHVGGIPPGDPVPRNAPLFMGFKSGLRRNQATEDASRSPPAIRWRDHDAGQLHALTTRQLVRRSQRA